MCCRAEDGQLSVKYRVYYGNKKADGIKISTDNKSGTNQFAGGDDERLWLELDKVPKEIISISLCVSLYQGAKELSKVNDVMIRLFDSSSGIETMDYADGHEYLRYKVNTKLIKESSLVLCQLVRKPNKKGWFIIAVGESCVGKNAKEMKTKRFEPFKF